MKLFGKLLIAALVIAGLAPFTFLKGKDGRPLMSFDQLSMPELGIPDLPEGVDLPGIDGAEPDGRDIVYQWTDADGLIQFSTRPPPAGVEFSVKGYDPNTNLIQSVKPKEAPVADAARGLQPEQTPPDVEIGNPYSPENVRKLIDDATQVQEVINQRYQQQEALMGR
jgi:hypothetical protein